MVFQSQRFWRTLYVRAGLLAAGFVVVGSVTLFQAHNPDPVRACTDCAPTAYTGGVLEEKVVALTFDDGPNAEATPQILDALEQADVHATFFLLGQRVVREPELVQEVAARGFAIGNHGFTHGENSHSSQNRVRRELNRTNKLIESLTGRSAVLYRPPYLLDMEDWQVVPGDDEKPVWGWVRKHGYIPVGADLDALDWQVTTKEGVVQNVEQLLTIKESYENGKQHHVFLMHDEPHTAEALPEILALLDERGYTVVPLHELLGFSETDVMPPAAATHENFYAVMLGITDRMHPILLFSVMLVTIVALVRIVVFAGFGTLLQRRIRNTPKQDIAPLSVSVLVPAYNEAENVKATVLSVLQNTRIPQEVLVINDGSTDDTELYARELEQQFPDKVRVITVPNGGKATALNVGVRETRGDLVVAIDGDTILDRYCIEHVVAPFGDANVGAVAGKIVAANARTLMERFQVLEYLVGQNLEKMVLGEIGALAVVPGAIGAWRRDALLHADCFSKDTLVEDQDLTLAILANGLQVRYAPGAIAYTEVPKTLRSFYLQRFRWTYGTFQCLWKYRMHLLSDRQYRLGLIALPYSLMFNAVLPLLSLVLLVTVIIGILVELYTPAIMFVLLYTLLDMGYAYAAMRFEKRSSHWMVLLVPLQRMYYLFVYALIIPMAFFKVLDGSGTRWNKLRRSGSAQLLYNELMAPKPVVVEGWTPTPAAASSSGS